MINRILEWIYAIFFKKIIRRILLKEQEVFNFHSKMELKQMIQRSFTNIKINNISGDYYEFGVYRGRSFLYALNTAKMYNRNRNIPIRCIGFDSFEGFPDPDPNKDEFKNLKGKQIWTKGYKSCSFSELKKILYDNNIEPDTYSLHKGFFEETLTAQLQKKLPPAAIVYIDCDLYDSTKLVLNFLKPLFQQGTIVMFDDYYCLKGNPKKGEAGALKEFLLENPNIEFLDWGRYKSIGQSFIVNLDI